MSEEAKQPGTNFKSLEDQVVKYNLKDLITQTEQDFEAKIGSKELVKQGDIEDFFNLGERINNARN